MVTGVVQPPRHDRAAIGLSIALHVCALALLATLPRAAFSTDVSDERTLLVSQITIERRPPPPPHARPRQLAAAHAAAAPRPVLQVAVTVEQARRPLVVLPEERYHATRPRPVITERHHRAIALTIVQPTREPVVAPRVAPPASVATSEPSAPPTAAAALVGNAPHDDGIGNFGETYAPSVDPQLRTALFNGIAGAVVVRVSVDESGHPTGVDFLRGPQDATARDQLRTRILALRFIPAQCNGIHCAGTVELRS